LELEVIALRHQLGLLRRKQKKKLQVSLAGRILWSWLYWLSPQVLNAMVLVRPDTVVGWHRKGFRLYWPWLAQDKRPQPVLTPAARELIRQMKLDNPLWGVRRIHGEILKLGFKIST
jgi:putative transposase